MNRLIISAGARIFSNVAGGAVTTELLQYDILITVSDENGSPVIENLEFLVFFHLVDEKGDELSFRGGPIQSVENDTYGLGMYHLIVSQPFGEVQTAPKLLAIVVNEMGVGDSGLGIHGRRIISQGKVIITAGAEDNFVL